MADCQGGEPSKRMPSASVGVSVCRPEQDVTNADTLKTAHASQLCVTGTTRQHDLPDGGLHHALSVSLIEGLAAAQRDWMSCWHTAFITLMQR